MLLQLQKKSFVTIFKIFRFVNKEDPVPNITKFTKLKHIGKTILLNTKEVNFHSLKDYEKILKNL